MGIAQALVRSWEGGTSQPTEVQMEQLGEILAFGLELRGTFGALSMTGHAQS